MKDILIRVFVSLAILSIGYVEETDIKTLIYIYLIAYITAAYLVKEISIYLLLALDVFTFSFSIYLLESLYLPIIYISLFISYINSKKTLILYFISLFTIVALELYTYQIIEVWFIGILIPFIISILMIFKHIKALQKDIDMKNSIINKKIKTIIEKNHMENSNILKIEHIDFKNLHKGLYQLYEITKTSGLAFFDIKNSKCINIGEIRCDKSFLKNITEPIGFIEKDNIAYITIEKNEEVIGILILKYKSNTFVDKLEEILFIKEKLTNELS